MKDRLSKLLTVKSIVTVILTVTYAGLAVWGRIPEELNTVYLTVIAFYFGTQVEKSKKE